VEIDVVDSTPHSALIVHFISNSSLSARCRVSLAWLLIGNSSAGSGRICREIACVTFLLCPILGDRRSWRRKSMSLIPRHIPALIVHFCRRLEPLRLLLWFLMRVVVPRAGHRQLSKAYSIIAYAACQAKCDGDPGEMYCDWARPSPGGWALELRSLPLGNLAGVRCPADPPNHGLHQRTSETRQQSSADHAFGSAACG